MSELRYKFDSQTLIVPTKNSLAQTTARLMIKAFRTILQRQSQLVFLPSSGQTPVETYQLLAQHYKHAIDWSRVVVVQMDEYWTKDLDPNFYFQHFLQTNLIDPLNIKRFLSMRKNNGEGFHTPENYSAKLSALGPIDFALHGIGRNGHVGFNEPNNRADSNVRVVRLARKTQDDNFPYMERREIPKYGMTLGLTELIEVKHTLLIASGMHKATALRGLINRAPVSEIPACALLDCPDFGFIADQAAAAEFL